MKQLSTYFVTALKAEVERGPRGTRSKLARLANISRGQVTDILNGIQNGSEETKRAIASALGWEYEELLKYGKCLTEGTEYKRPELKAPAYDPGLYLSVPFFKKVRPVAGSEGKVPAPDDSDHHPPLLLYKPLLGEYAKSKYLAAFSINDDSMEPILPQHGAAIVDIADRVKNDGKLFLLAQSQTSEKYIIRRLRCDGDELYLISDNDAYPPKLLKPAWDKIVVGRVVWSFLPQE